MDMDGEKEMEDLGKLEENPQENAGKLATVKEDGDSESPVKQPASVSFVSGDGVNVPSKDEEVVSLNGHKDANANETVGDIKNDCDGTRLTPENQLEDEAASGGSLGVIAEENKMVNEEISGKGGLKPGCEAESKTGTSSTGQMTSWETQYEDGEESGTEEEQYTFRREVENFYKEKNFEFKAPKFYKEDVNLLK